MHKFAKMVIIHNGTQRSSEVNEKTASILVKSGRYRYETDKVPMTINQAAIYIEAKLKELAEREAIIEAKERLFNEQINQTNGESIEEIRIDELGQPKRRGRKSK
jgi:hypothetical protein